MIDLSSNPRQDEDLPALVHRFWSEYRDLPGLCLSVPQAKRLFGIDDHVCHQVVGALTTAGHVHLNDGGLIETRGVPPAGTRTESAGPLPATSAAAAGVSERDHRRHRILVVEDDPTQLSGISVGLTAAGYSVFSAINASGGTAFAFLIPDLIILDIGLPDSDGHSVAHCLRAHPETRDIPIVYLSARSGPEEVRRARENGAVQFLLKPCRARTLVKAVEQILDGPSIR